MNRYVKRNLNYTHLKIEKLNPDEYHRHIHNRYELLYFIDGNADYFINAMVYHLKPGDLLFIPAYSYHHLSPNLNSSYERICIHFPKELIPTHILSTIEDFKQIYHIEKNSLIEKIFSSLIQCEYVYKYKDNDMIFLIQQAIGNIFTHLVYLQNIEEPISVIVNSELKNILDYIDTHIQEPLNTNILSKTFFKSTSWINHTFTHFLKISPQKYINNKKILYAQQLIINGTPPMQTAYLLSFENYVTFYRAYLKFLGNTPNHDFQR